MISKIRDVIIRYKTGVRTWSLHNESNRRRLLELGGVFSSGGGRLGAGVLPARAPPFSNEPVPFSNEPLAAGFDGCDPALFAAFGRKGSKMKFVVSTNGKLIMAAGRTHAPMPARPVSPVDASCGGGGGGGGGGGAGAFVLPPAGSPSTRPGTAP